MKQIIKQFLNFWKPYTLGFVKELFLVWLFALCWVSFCNAWSYTYTWHFEFEKTDTNMVANQRMVSLFVDTNIYTPPTDPNNLFEYPWSTLNCTFTNYSDWTISLRWSNLYYYNQKWNPAWQNTTFTLQNWYSASWNNWIMVWLLIYSTSEITNSLSFDYSCTFQSDWIFGEKVCPTCPDQYSSLECQSEYSLIPISSVDSNYCTTNWFCFSSWDCWTWSINWSSLFINDIQHLWKPIISIDIPEEINWDYTSTDTEFNVEVIGYNVDYEKMNQTLSIQKYNPTSEDFTQVVWILAPYMKIFLFILFIFIVIKRLKKPFKSRLK